MGSKIAQEAKRAIRAGAKLQSYYRSMQQDASNPKVKAVLHDLLLMEEMNEMLLRSLHKSL